MKSHLAALTLLGLSLAALSGCATHRKEMS